LEKINGRINLTRKNQFLTLFKLGRYAMIMKYIFHYVDIANDGTIVLKLSNVATE